MDSIDDIFLNAQEIAAPAERAAYLDRACGNDASLRQRVEAMLRDADGAGKFFGAEKTVVMTSPAAAPRAPLGTVRYFGNYELLEEIARGGMGVVYKARQPSLNRIVALKMILSGQLASEAEVKRFRLEAEAAANLQHPNIVAIHEVGQHEGRHYFSMDFVEGTNLAQFIKDKPLPPIKAAELLQSIAETVHFAHQRGTLHRDLKPQNILIDPSGQPRITDFGLAKRAAAADGSLTQTGAVMGSPSYMPPEQALGKQELIGPASDVYSLGAMLYQLLTGQTPFTAETPVAILHKVVEQEPVPPSRLNGKIPADLETICLKCMEKRPERRYPSARELAEELGRFLNQEPILARPACVPRKMYSWLLRHPWAIAAICSLAVLGVTALAYGLWEEAQFARWQLAHPGQSPYLTASDRFDSNALFPLSLFAFLSTMGLFVAFMVAQGMQEQHRRGKRVLLGLGCALDGSAPRYFAVAGCVAVAVSVYEMYKIVYGTVWVRNFWPDYTFSLSVWALCTGWFGMIPVFWHWRRRYAEAAGEKPLPYRMLDRQLVFPKIRWRVTGWLALAEIAVLQGGFLLFHATAKDPGVEWMTYFASALGMTLLIGLLKFSKDILMLLPKMLVTLDFRMVRQPGASEAMEKRASIIGGASGILMAAATIAITAAVNLQGPLDGLLIGLLFGVAINTQMIRPE